MIHRLVIASIAAAVLLGGAVTSQARAETLEDILNEGKVVVGVKADYKPWGFRNEDGEIVGMEIDLAQDVADRLGVELETVAVAAANRMEFLQQGRIDLIIATMGDTAKRREVIGMVVPAYYAGGSNVLAPEGRYSKWEDLKGERICGIQGAYYNKGVAQSYGAEVVAFKGIPEVEQALQSNRCGGFLYDNTWIQSKLAGEGWDGYEMPFKTEDFRAWAVGVRQEDQGKAFGRFVAGTVYHWHQTGQLLDLEKKWEIAESQFLVDMHEKLKDTPPE